MSQIKEEIKKGSRFEFGKNWHSFLSVLTEERIKIAEMSLQEMLNTRSLSGKTFLDAGSGSGLFSLAARRLGAKVYSFDFDPVSVTCTREIRDRYFKDDSNWIIEEGSVLDQKYLDSLGSFDIVYSWGVLHHTGNMWKALENVAVPVKQSGLLFIGIYNDQGRRSRRWRMVKKIYCSGLAGKLITSVFFIPLFFLRAAVESVLGRENLFENYKKNRGMSITHDWFDWLGGYPYEFASSGEIVQFCRRLGFDLRNMITSPGRGINQFVFIKH